MAVEGKKEWRKQVTLGPLPADFLCVGPSGAEQAQAQAAVDAATAQMLQHQSYMSFVPPNTRGRLSISIQEARLTRNYGLVRMDPYCRVRVANTVFETPTHPSGGKMPRWNRTVHCYLPEGIDCLHVEIFDERALTNDERVAWATVKIPPAVMRHEAIDEWYPLSGEQGEDKEGMINLVLQLAPLDAPRVAYVPVAGPGPAAVGVDAAAAAAAAAAADVPAGPLYTPQDVSELHEMFPTMSEEVIASVLDEKRGNKAAAVNALLLITDDAANDAAAKEQAPADAKDAGDKA